MNASSPDRLTKFSAGFPSSSIEKLESQGPQKDSIMALT